MHVSRLPTTLHRCCDCHRLLQKAVKEAEASLAATERQLSEAAGKLAASEKEVAVALTSATSWEGCLVAVADRSKVDPKRERAFFKLSKSL